MTVGLAVSLVLLDVVRLVLVVPVLRTVSVILSAVVAAALATSAAWPRILRLMPVRTRTRFVACLDGLVIGRLLRLLLTMWFGALLMLQIDMLAYHH